MLPAWRRYRKYGEVPWRRYKTFSLDESVPGQGVAAAKTFRSLQMDEVMVQRFFNKFNEIDHHGRGEVDLDDFYGYFNINRSPFGDRVFRMLDSDSSGTIDFREFVACVWNFCTYQMATFLEFAFRMYDLDNSGQLEMEELRDLVEEVYGDMMANNVRVQRILDKIDTDGDGVVSFAEFAEFNRVYPALLLPAFSMQNEIRRRCFGETFWRTEYHRRLLMTDGRTRDIFDLLDVMDGGSQAATGLEQLKALNEHSAEAQRRAEALRKLQHAGGGGGGAGAGHELSAALMQELAKPSTAYTYDPHADDSRAFCERVKQERRRQLLASHRREQRAAAARDPSQQGLDGGGTGDGAGGLALAPASAEQGGMSWGRALRERIKRRNGAVVPRAGGDKGLLVMSSGAGQKKPGARHDLPCFLEDL
eukprot:g4992.t1